MGVGLRNGSWTLEAPEEEEGGAIVRVTSALGSVKAYLVADSHIATCLMHRGFLQRSDDVIVIHSSRRPQAVQRAPQRAPGRTGEIGIREVSIAELLDETTTHRELVQRFRQEVAV